MERIGLIAGNGRLPLIFARAARNLGIRVIAVAHQGETDAELAGLVDSIAWIRVGELGKLIRTFRQSGVARAVMAGGIHKAALFKNFVPDARARVFLARLAQRGDDAVLRGLAGELEREGIEVLDSTAFLGAMVMPEGCLAKRAPAAREWVDIHYGAAVARSVGRWDVGQTVVVKDSVVLAVEAIEGTDAAVRRGAALGGPGAVVVKVSKPGQDLRFDVPVIGLPTVELCGAAGVTAIALEADRTLLLDREELVRKASAGGLAVVGIRVEEES